MLINYASCVVVRLLIACCERLIRYPTVRIRAFGMHEEPGEA
ncbi:hypothetical protein SAMN05421665_1272 [Yoonia rosea]|uniref:Uncharacterized protein n=1 Tax=Yoonia rosea TaxID=287098 RepID=A0A1R3WTY1_9RHOB|nr:hypothetical protein SAMN05421665_1272 [Yoonia rosea]